VLTRLHVSQLREGMYVHALCASWLAHDFWRGAFRIDGPAVLERLRRSRVEEVWIDASRSDPSSLADVAVGGWPQARPLRGEAMGSDDACAAAEGSTSVGTPGPQAAPAPSPRAGERTPRTRRADPAADFSAGLGRADRAVRDAKAAVAAIFREARKAGRLDRDRVRATVAALQGAVLRDPGPMLALLRLKHADEYTTLHSVAVGALMLQLSRTLGLDAADQERAVAAGLLHDIGKAAVPTEVLNKTGALDEDEWRIVRGHPAAGHALLRESGDVDDAVLAACRHHHERVDGGGYPDGLTGDRLSLFARMTAVCDVYDAVTSNRPYKRAWTPAEALGRMSASRAGHFDETVFRAFVRTVGAHPVGTLVRLRSMRLAIVVAQHPERLRTPTVRTFYSIALQERIAPRTMDLSEHDDAIVAEEDPGAWGLPPLETLLA
jgi:putative nucleotidyltransferase with HDIG domain